MSRASIHLVRHGEVFNPDGVLYGRLPEFHLSDLGREMADRVAAYFGERRNDGAKLVHLVASPLTRAQETAAPIARALGLEAITDERILEAENRFEGLPGVKRQLRNPVKPSWGEPYVHQVDRVMAAVHDARIRALELGGSGAEAILVSHQLPIWVTRLAAEGRRLWHDPRSRECTLTSVTTLDFNDMELIGVRYAEPSADLLPGAANLPGA